MKMRYLLVMISMLLAVSNLFAVPAKPVKKRAKTVSGSSIEVTLCGDEYFSFYKDDLGVPYILQPDGLLEAKSFDEVCEIWTSRRNSQLDAEVSSASRRGSYVKRRVGTPSVTTGNHRGLVILIEFDDVKFVTPNTQSTFNRFFNEINYRENGMAGSVKDYFLAQSYNQLNIDFDVVGPYTTTYKMAYYGAETENSHDVRPVEMIDEAITKASKDVDFSNYDWDGDGEVDQVFVVYAGYNQAQGANANTIWPHESSLKGHGIYKTYNGVDIDIYGCSSELQGDGVHDTGIMDGIGTACHEFSHCLGLPDMYDTKGNNYAMSYWDIMSSGSYNDDSRTPAGYTAYERMFSGWLTPIELKEKTTITDMKPLATHPEAYILYNEANRNEYYLLENRQPLGFDAGLFGHGLLIVHVDYNEEAWRSNTVNALNLRQRMTVIPADNNFIQSINGIGGDAWPGISGNTQLTNFTSPAATLYNNNTDGTKFMSKNIDHITENNTTNTVSFVACRPEVGIPSPDGGTVQTDGTSFKVTWPAVDGAVSYELELTEISSVPTTPEEALMRNVDLSQFKTKSVGFSDISSKLSGYGLAGWSGSQLFTSPKYIKFGTTSATGYLQTPSWWVAPDSKEITFVIGAEAYSGSVNVGLTFESAIRGGTSTQIVKEAVSYTVSDDAKQVFNFTIPKANDLFRLTISPDAIMYLNYFAIYEGTWTAEQLGINSRNNNVMRRAATTQNFSTTSTSFTFTGLNVANRFIYRVRTLGADDIYSQWSEEQIFTFGSTTIMGITDDANSPVRYFDLQGREVDASHRGLVIMQQGNTVKKVIR